MPLTDFQKGLIEDYAALGDREHEPVFVGRENLFDLVASNARMASQGHAKGRTICIAGPPGVGKTAFLSELKRRVETPEWRGPPTACVSVPAANLHSPGLVLATIASQMPEAWRRGEAEARKLLGRLTGAGVGFGAFGFSLSASAAWDAAKPESDPTMPWMKAAEIPDKDKTPSSFAICLLVDEAHSLRPSPGETINRLLQSLHEGPPSGGGALAAFAVLAGHTHTPEVLEKSLSRRLADGNLQYMESLSEADSLRYVEGTLDHLGVSRTEPGRNALAYWIVRECAGFPHHLRNAMSAVAEGMLRTNSPRLADLNGGFVSERLRTGREEYYAQRTEGALSDAKPQIGALLRDWGRRNAPLGKAEAKDALDDLLATLPQSRRKRMGKAGVEDGEDLMREMIGNGALMPTAKGGVRGCPIDSLIAWMETDGQGHAMRAPFPALPAPRERP